MSPPANGNDGEDSSQPPKKRVRTDEQLDRKRQKDRAKHKANRAESKTQLSNIEQDVAQVRSHLERLLYKLESLGQVASTESSPPARVSAGEHRLERGSSWTDTQSSTAGDSPAKAALPAIEAVPKLPNIQLPTQCRCGIKHAITDCPSYSGVAMLYQVHTAMAANPDLVTNMPRSPTMATYMLMNLDDTNPVTRMLNHNIRQFPTKDVETLWAFHFICYRLFRWRLCPTKEIIADVPPFLRPTEIQQSVVHSLNIDYVPWPKLRDHLALHLNEEDTHTVKMYMESFQFIWPKELPLLVRDEPGNIALHPEFEARASDLANWRMGSPWREACPELHHLVSE